MRAAAWWYFVSGGRREMEEGSTWTKDRAKG